MLRFQKRAEYKTKEQRIRPIRPASTERRSARAENAKNAEKEANKNGNYKTTIK